MRKLTTFILTLTVFAVAGCSLLSSGDAGPSSDVDVLVGPTWKMVAQYDSYDDTWHPRSGEGAAESILLFEEDGTFMQDNVGGCCQRVGTWSLLGEEGKLVLSYEGGTEAEYDVRLLEEGELRLAWTGRHGPVINKYEPE